MELIWTRRNAPAAGTDTGLRAGQRIVPSDYRFQDFLRQGQDMSFLRRTLVLTWVMVLFAQGQAAEFSQVRPDADALMQLPVNEWLTNGEICTTGIFSA